MIEPTESESKAELDRFVAALVAIRGEIDEIARALYRRTTTRSSRRRTRSRWS